MRSQKLDIRGLQTHIQEWGRADSPKLFMLHGWMDCGASYQYMMPFLADHFHVIAPDLRGFGETEHAPGGYWFPDYLADLDILLDYYAPTAKVDLLGHSMGGNIVLMYAGVKAERVARVLSLEGLGLPPTEPADTPAKYQQWMQQILSNEPSKIYPNSNVLKQSIYRGNPSLPDNIIDDLAELWGKPVGSNGAVALKHDHKHRYTNPIRYNAEDVEAIWKSIKAKTGLVMAEESMMYKKYGATGLMDNVKRVLRVAPEHYYLVKKSNHMLHLEQPKNTAECVLDFFSDRNPNQPKGTM